MSVQSQVIIRSDSVYMKTFMGTDIYSVYEKVAMRSRLQKVADSKGFRLASLVALVIVAAEVLSVDIQGQIAQVFLKFSSRDGTHSTPKTSFLVEDSNRWACGQLVEKSYGEWVIEDTPAASDEEVLCAAHRLSTRTLPPGTPRVAFLFMTRGEMPLEPVWRRFFAGHEDKYSIYVHATDRERYEYPNNSLFYGKTIPSKPVDRFGISFSEAVRRLVAYALLDSSVPNTWFTVLCEASIPIRSFPFVYQYFMNSELSFVEGFVTRDWLWRGWQDRDQARILSNDKIRKGEPWISVHRRHAGLIVGDFFIYLRFKYFWHKQGLASELYIPTMFNVADSGGIANRTVMYVDWLHGFDAHPFRFNETSLTPSVVHRLQSQTRNTDGFYNKSVTGGFENQQSCVYNGRPNSTCYLFARKVGGNTELLNLVLQSAHVFGPPPP